MQPNSNPNQPKSTDGFRSPNTDPRSTTDGFGRTLPTPPPRQPQSHDLQQRPNYPHQGLQSSQQPTYPNQAQTQQPMRQTYPPNQPYHQPDPNRDKLPPPTNQPVTGDNDFANAKKRKRKDDIKNTIFTVLLFILAPLFAVFMIVFVFQSYVVDGSSMDPTLQNGDRVFILKLPKSIANMQDKQWTPTRNEIIVFKKPNNEGTQLIKRVIGLPGDKIVIENGSATVYNIDNPSGFDPSEGTEYEGTLAEYGPEQDGEYNVGQGELFVLGDNRTPGGSLDSHSGLGLVPIENVVGRLWIRYFPLSGFEFYADTVKEFNLAF